MSYEPPSPAPATAAGDPVTLPVAPARCPFDPPEELAGLRDEDPLRPMRFPDGHVGWLATGHSAVRAILADPRFSSRYELLHYPYEGDFPDEIPPAPVGDLTGIDPPEHTRYRRLLAGKFTVRRMRLLGERVAELADEHVDAMRRTGPPVDLVAAFARPIPALMICELLGVPYAERATFQDRAVTLNDRDAGAEEMRAAIDGLRGYVRDLVAAKRAAPTDDLLSDLTTTDLTDTEIAGLGSLLLAAGLDTTANMLALGTFALLENPPAQAALRSGPDQAAAAVEELMRYLTIIQLGVRTALEDVEVDGRPIRAGDSVVISVEAANRDPLRFPDPGSLDPHRTTTGHLGFGHGVHQCLGQHLARLEMRTAFSALFTAFPTLRLAVRPDDVPIRTGNDIKGLHALPVTWEV